jgi:hypothetical protein
MNPIARRYMATTPLWAIAQKFNDRNKIAAWERGNRTGNPPSGFKRQVIGKYAADYGLDIMVETGTFLGEMPFAMRNTFARIVTIELSLELYADAAIRFARFPHIECLQGDSGTLLPDVIAKIQEPCLFWLDAHYSKGQTACAEIETPVSTELEVIFSHPIRNHVILIDDARLFDGTHDYPRIEDLEKSVARARPDLHFSVEHDIIRILPRPS